jgi:putative acetyltransferase
MFKISEDDLSSHATRQLLALHLAGMHVNSPPESVYALDLSGLKEPEVTVWSVWEASRCLSNSRRYALYDKSGLISAVIIGSPSAPGLLDEDFGEVS